MPKLVILDGPERGRTIELQEGSESVIGRSSECDVTLADAEASRKHCQVAYADGRLSITDLDSSNGTFVNGRRATKAPLEAGDVVAVGDTKMQVEGKESRDAAAATTMVPDGKRGPVARDPFIGRTFGGYKILERLGEGRLGTPYQVMHELTKNVVLMKILSPMMAHKDELVQRFIRQAKAGADLNHPNVVQTLGAGKEGKVYYIVTEYVQGRSLRERCHGAPLEQGQVHAANGGEQEGEERGADDSTCR